MAKHIDCITVATPTGLTPTLQAGGVLTLGTTYYYRVIAIRAYGNGVAFSLPSAEVEATPDATNKTVALTWDATNDASGYILQRTTVSGSYPVDGPGNTLNLNGQAWAGYPYATTQTALVDDGGASLNVRFNSPNLDFSQAIPVIECYGDSVSDVITPWDIYNASVAGGWGAADIIATPGMKMATAQVWKDELAYVFYAHLYIRFCTFRLKGMLITVLGQTYININCQFEMGGLTGQYMPYILSYSPYYIPYTNNGNTFTAYFMCRRYLNGAANSFARFLISRPLNPQSDLGGYRSAQVGPGINFYPNFTECILGLGTMSGMSVNALTATNPLLESLAVYGSTPLNTTIRLRLASEGFSCRYIHNYLLTNPVCTSAGCDICWGTCKGGAEVNGVWQSQGQTDNQPYFKLYAPNVSYADNTLIRQVTIALKVVDDAGNPINGAVVTFRDAPGNSDIWVASGATYSTALNNTDVTSTLTVSNGALFSAGDIIRLETYGELLQVQSINGNILTVVRGYGGTTKRATGVNSYASQRVLKQLASLTTGADGEALFTEAITMKELAISGISSFRGGYENDLVTAGYLARQMRTPHTLTITKTGYQLYHNSISVDRKMDLEIALQRLNTLPADAGLLPMGVMEAIV
ncbi:MAG: hypothetical protein M0P73_08650 [Syntrophobacterales bacterium]|jgi:hypothetical protein|nr:hypothetical protein [Syntrophobacterales bacterium]